MTIMMSLPIMLSISKQIDASEKEKFNKDEITTMVLSAFRDLDKDMEQVKLVNEGKMDKKDFKPSCVS